jgi:hypothetical protein
MREIASEICSQVLLPGVNVVVVGPLVRRANVFVDVPPVYFVLGSDDGSGYFSAIAGAETIEDAMAVRDAVVAGLKDHRPAVCVVEHSAN